MFQPRTVSRTSRVADAFNSFSLSSQGEARSLFISRWRQGLASFSATLTMVVVGTVYGWTTISLVYLLTGTGGVPLKLTDDEASWMVSFTVLGSMMGSLLAAKLAVRGGRRNCFLLCNTMFTVGWFMTYIASYVLNLYLARVILGIGVGIARTVNPVYASEVTDIKIRGSLGFLITLNETTGLIVTYALGVWLTYESLLLFLVIISFMCFLSSTCFSATRYFSEATDQMVQAWKWNEFYNIIKNPQTEEIELRAPRAQTRQELHSQSTSQLQQPSTSEIHTEPTREIHPEPTRETRPQPTRETRPQPTRETHPEPTREIHPQIRRELHHLNILTQYTWSTKLRALLERKNRKALVIMLGLVMAQQFSGNLITIQYMNVLFHKIKITIEPNIATMLVLTVGLLFGSFINLLLESLDRRELLLMSTSGTCLALVILALYLFLVQYKYDVFSGSNLPVANLILHQITFQMGLSTLPNVLLCELFPAELKGFVGAIIVIFDGIIGFTVSKLYQVLTDNVGPSFIYIIFATVCSFAFLMVFFWLPETKGKRYREIEALLARKSWNIWNEE